MTRAGIAVLMGLALFAGDPAGAQSPSATATVVVTPPPLPDAPIAAVRRGDSLGLVLPGAATIPAALFRLGDAAWLVLDTHAAIELAGLAQAPERRLRDVELVDLARGRAVRIPLADDEHIAAGARGADLSISIGALPAGESRPLILDRILTADGLASAFVPLPGARAPLRMRDPATGEELLVVAAPLPARGVRREQTLVDFRLLESAHGVVVAPRADDLAVEATGDGIGIARPGGLRMTDDGSVATAPSDAKIFGALSWQVDRDGRFRQREAELLAALADGPEAGREAARMALARFYLANELGAEAKGVLDATSRAARMAREAAALRGLALLMLNRAEEAIDELTSPALAQSGEGALIRVAALATAGRYVEASDLFRTWARDLQALPRPLQRIVGMAALRAAIELDRTEDAGALLLALEAREPAGLIEPRLAVLAGRLAARIGQEANAARLFSAAENSGDEIAAAEARHYRQAVKRTRESAAIP